MSNKIFPTDTTVKATLVAADQFLIADSAASNKVKDITGTILNTFVRGAGGNVVVSDGDWIGISGSDERIVFNAAGTITMLGVDVGVREPSPTRVFEIKGKEDNSTDEEILALINGGAAGAWDANIVKSLVFRGGEGGSDVKSKIGSYPVAVGDWNLGLYTTTDGGTNVLERLTITHDGSVIIGHTDGAGSFNVIKDNTTVYFDSYRASAAANYTYYRHSRHATIGTVFTTNSGDILGLLSFQGVNAAGTPAFADGAFIYAKQDGAAGATYVPTNIFMETSSASALNTNQLVLHNDNYVFIGDDGTSTLTGDFNVVSTTQTEINVANFSAATSSRVCFYRSLGAIGTLTDTEDGDILGDIIFYGVDNTQAWEAGSKIRVTQKGAAGARMPTTMLLDASSAASPSNVKLLLDGVLGNITINAAEALSAHYDLALLGDGVLCVKETTTPTADTNYGKIYCKDDNKLYFQDGAGNENEIQFVS